MAFRDMTLLEDVIERGKRASSQPYFKAAELDGVPYKIVEYPHDGSIQFQLDLTDVMSPHFGVPLGHLARQLNGNSQVRVAHAVNRDAIYESRMHLDDARDAHMLETIVKGAIKRTENQISQEAQEKGISLDTSPPKVSYEYDLADVTTFDSPYRQRIPVVGYDRAPSQEELDRARLNSFEEMRRKEAQRQREHEANKRELEALAKQQTDQAILESNELYGEWA